MGTNQSTQRTAETTNHLAFKLLKILAEKESGNICISPLSLISALSMLFCGACDATASEILEVLGLSGISSNDVTASFEHIMSSLNNATSGYTLECANAAIFQSNFSIKDDYTKLLEKSFQATVMQEDFGGRKQAVVDRINKWVESKTHGMISQLIDSLDTLTVMVLLNAIYFKGVWKNKFSEKATRPEMFYNKGSRENAKYVRMMHLKEKFNYAEFETHQALQLPYEGDHIAMLILLPNSLHGLEELEKHLTPEYMKKLGENMRGTQIKVSLPKFKMEYSKSLKETFQELGMRKAFEDEANLSGISDSDNLKVSDIFHKAVIEVNEEGTVAAAATAVANRMVRCREPEFTVNRPFLFIIYDTRINTNIFIGRIVEL